MKPLVELKDCKAYQEAEGAIENYNNLRGKTISSVEMDDEGSFYRIHFTSGDWADFSSSIDDACGNKAVVRSSLVFVPANAKRRNEVQAQPSRNFLARLVRSDFDLESALRNIGLALSACHNCVATDTPSVEPNETSWRIDNSKEIELINKLESFINTDNDPECDDCRPVPCSLVLDALAWAESDEEFIDRKIESRLRDSGRWASAGENACEILAGYIRKIQANVQSEATPPEPQ